MSASMTSTLAATLIATVVGLAAWFLGFARTIWPTHPQMAAFLITLLVTLLVKQVWPAIARGSGN